MTRAKFSSAGSPLSGSDVKQAIIAGGVIGIVRTTDAERAVELARQVWRAGVGVVEVAMTTPGALSAIESLSSELDQHRVIGAGTVLDAASARLAVLAGARLLVTPTLVEDVIEVGQRYDVATVIGGSSPTELLRATTLGADLVKVFPASLWSPKILADVLQALPQLECVPTGGVSPDDAAGWIDAGAVAVGIGSGLTKGDDPATRVRTLLQAIQRARAQ
ncbi:MAG TPA: bifunctional 4-hydroxy-2-oxoglutarate aldolase/2-dehydro-3-deoxy-phosphogluconate aldolase [Propionibacteriaceae bacterium]|nr:bifunctional 4-hydroxy-2-oxoglutarate aldolase/2-dehydro-3-deoxy-phosphogluconate aldolase [Propionibacteriaceae bacterium]